MKAALLIIVMFLSHLSFSQAWRDSLEFARSAYKKGDYGTATRYYESAQKKAPEHIDLSDEMAQSAYKAREFERAEKIYQQSSASKKTQSQKSDSYHNLGNSRMKKKDYKGAIDAYKESLRNDPTNKETRYNLSEAIRKEREEQKKKDKDQDKDKDKNKDQENKDQRDKDGDKEGDKGQDSKNKDQGKDAKNNSGNQPKNQNHSNDSQSSNQKNANLPNKSVERMLDELMKAESATKRKIGGQKGYGSTNRSGKDW